MPRVVAATATHGTMATLYREGAAELFPWKEYNIYEYKRIDFSQVMPNLKCKGFLCCDLYR